METSRRELLMGAIGTAFMPDTDSQANKPNPILPRIGEPRIHLKKVVINALSDFEAASAADINGDGKIDIISGDTWYEAPYWNPHKFRNISVWGRGPGSSGYRGDFADLPLDVTGNGKIDIVSSDYSTAEIYWHENPGDSKDLWERHLIAKPGSAETTVFAPILGKNTPCILPNCANQVVWYELRKRGKKPEWVEHIVGKAGAGHGIGFGDVNGDGKTDLITPTGWYEQIDAQKDQWKWHPDWNCNPGDLGIGTPTFDFDGDGKNEIVFASGHNYGVYMLRRKASNPNQWEQVTIDSSWSQGHTLILANMESNVMPVVVTGKRYLAHDHDPGAEDPMCVYYYRYDRKAKAWVRHTIDEGARTGVGLQLTAMDIRGTGRLDLICPGKSGLYLFENHGKV